MGKQTDGPAPAAKVKRVPVGKLTDSEKDDLKAQGVDLDQDFVDVEIGQAPPKVDPKASERAEAAKSLESVVAPPAEQESKDQEKEDLQRRVNELEEQWGGRRLHCPRCAWPVETDIEFEPTKGDIADFLEAVSAGELYRKTFSSYGGSLKVTFRTKYSCEMEAIKKAVADESEGVMSEDMLLLTDDLVFLASIDQIELKGKARPFTSLRELLKKREAEEEAGETVKSVIQILRERVEDLPTPHRVELKSRYVEFSMVVEHLMSRAQDPKYWTGTNDSA